MHAEHGDLNPGSGRGWAPPTAAAPSRRLGIKRMLAVLTGGALLALPSLLLAQALPLGAEFPVNTFTTGYQREPALAAGTSGAFVVVWESQNQDGDIAGVYGQRFDSAGAPAGSEFPVNTVTAKRQSAASIALALDHFLVSWDDGDGADVGVSARAFTADGTPLAPQFAVASPPGLHSGNAMAAAPDGTVLVVWTDSVTVPPQVWGQRYDGSGNLLGSAFQISTDLALGGYSPAVAADGLGHFIVAWIDNGVEIFAQRFDTAGTPVGPQLLVNFDDPDLGDYVYTPTVAADGAGNFAVVWVRLV